MNLLPPRYLFCLLFVVMSMVPGIVLAAGNEIMVAVVHDGPSQRDYLPVQIIERETRALMGREFDVKFPAAKTRHGGWNVEGIRAAIQDVLNDDEVDVVIANGLITGHEIMRIANLNKPVIAPIVADAVLQNLPNDDGRSGKHNLVYLADDHTVGSDLDLFHKMIAFKHLGIFVDRLFVDTLPELVQTTANARERLNIEISLIPVEGDVARAMSEVPASVDAVYVPPLPRFSKDAMQELATALINRRTPSFSLLGLDTLELGLLMSGAGRSVDVTRAARRVALNLQAILLGTNASELKVGLSQPQKLAINMRTARAIGYSPRWREMESAILLHEEPDGARPKYTLVDALGRSLDRNLALQIRRVDNELARNDVQAARAALLPQIGANTSTTLIDEDRAGPAFSAEHEARAGVEASQLVYSERFRSAYDIARFLASAENFGVQITALDVVRQTATAYLEVLQAQAQEAVRKTNVELTETNLELALSRQKIGQTGRSDVYRWQSQLASDRQSLYAARAVADQAMTELKRILNLDLSVDIEVGDDGIAGLIKMLDAERFRRFFDNPHKLSIFRRYQIERALENAPELMQIDAQIAAGERSLLATRRAYYVPDVSVVGQAASNFYRGGSGAGRTGTGLDDEEWSIGVQATLPIFEGGRRRVEKNIAANQIRQLELSRADTRNTVEARAIAALQQTGASYPAMRLSLEAARTAQANLNLVTEAYSVGTVSVIQLIDAQGAALRAELSAAQARYTFMIDFVTVQRAAADFGLLLDADGAESWYGDVDSYFKQYGE